MSLTWEEEEANREHEEMLKEGSGCIVVDGMIPNAFLIQSCMSDHNDAMAEDRSWVQTIRDVVSSGG